MNVFTIWTSINKVTQKSMMKITGSKILVRFGMARAILEFQDEKSLTFTIQEKEGKEVDITETVEIKLTEIRPQLYLVTWKEKSGTTVTQVQDYENGIIYSNWTSPDGEFTNLTGTLNVLATSDLIPEKH